MSTTGLDIFDKTIHETHGWLRIVMEELETDDRKMAFTALRALLHAVRDRVGPENAVKFAAQLPMLLRGAFYEGWHPASTPTHERHLVDFVAHVGAMLPDRIGISPENAAVAGFAAMAEQLDEGEVRKLARLLPVETQILWPEYLLEPSASQRH